MTAPATYTDAVRYTLHTRWAGQKDGARAAQRASSAGVGPTEPLGAAFSRARAHGVRERLRSAGLAPASVNRALAAYLAVWGTCHQAGFVAEPPPAGLYLKEPRGRDRVVTEAELGALCAEMPPAYSGLLVFLWETGCRVGEALKLTRRDVHPTARTVVFTATKNGSDREVPLTARAALVLQKAPTTLFAHLSQSAFNHHWGIARSRMGLEGDAGFVPHAIRHAAVTRWAVAGVPMPVVAQLAGHRSLKTTARYTHPTVDHAREALEKVGIQ